MFFRNLSLYRFAPTFQLTEGELQQALEAHVLRPCGPLEFATHGAVPAVGGETEPLVYSQGPYLGFRIGSHTKVLPAAVVNQTLAQQVHEISQDQGRPVSGKERRRLKETLYCQLLTEAFTCTTAVSGYFDTRDGWLVLDTASTPVADRVMGVLREAIGSLPVYPVTSLRAPDIMFSDWLAGTQLPQELVLGDECQLTGPENISQWRASKEALADSDVILKHLVEGQQVTRLAFIFRDRLSFVLDATMRVRKLRFLDAAVKDLPDSDDAITEQKTHFTLMVLELQQLLDFLQTQFVIPRP